MRGALGEIVHWDSGKGYGFVRPHGGGVNVFTHIKDVDGNVEPELGAVVRYELGTGRDGRTCATNVRVLEGEELEREMAWPSAQHQRR